MLGDDEIEAMVRRTRTSTFGPGFSTRVLQRARALQQQTLGSMLQRYFVWLVPVAVAAIALLAFLNARATRAGGIDGVLGLPRVTLEAAYALDAATTAP